MGIYHVGPVDWDYDEYDAFVIVAESPEQARSIAVHKGGAKFHGAEITKIGVADHPLPHIVLGSFHAG